LLRAADYGRVASWHLNLDPAIVALSTEAIGRCNGLPVMDRSVQRVLALTADEQCDLGDLVAALEADPALAVNLLRYANSAYVGRPIQAKTVRQAVVMIGRQATRQLCLEAVTFRFFEAAPGNGRMSRGQMHLHAVAVARVAAATATMVSIPTDVPHLAGLLHDCGKLVMPLAFGEEAMDEIAALHPSGAARSAAEWDRFGIDHAYAGALFAEQSGLADELVTAIAWHHGGRRGDVTPNTEIACLQLANTIVGMLAGEFPDEALLAGELGALELSVDALDELAEAAGAGPASTPSAGLGDRVAELERLASIDELTGLANRRHWMATIRQAMESGASGNVLLCDLDRFKEVNDTHGHSAGDLVLMEVSRILQRHGVAGRIGGDEFAVWVAGDTPIEVADQIVDEVGGAFDGGNGLSVGVSVGVAPMLRDLSAALEAADRALYKAKSAGRGRVQLYDEAPELVV
jgi:diguanylate cyclase (GGDEF)-like protein/putative nucleotidyltransferase with HDIG domain